MFSGAKNSLGVFELHNLGARILVGHWRQDADRVARGDWRGSSSYFCLRQIAYKSRPFFDDETPEENFDRVLAESFQAIWLGRRYHVSAQHGSAYRMAGGR
jgi:hypothetical protein